LFMEWVGKDAVDDFLKAIALLILLY